MTQQQLWAPWRLPYIVQADEQKPSGCFLCRYREADHEHDSENYVVLRGERSFVVLNRFPYNNGHMLVAPLAHVGELGELQDEVILECMQQLRLMTAVCQEVMSPDGFNIGLNLGRAAGAGLPGHLHWHLVPRWSGDTNFMSVVGDVNIIPQSLDALYQLLRNALIEAGNS